jgi:PAS domain S-box-containing protein
MVNPDVSPIKPDRLVDQEIIKLKDFYQTILENIHDGILVTDRNDIIIYVNPGMEKIAGVKAIDILGRSIYRDFPPETIGFFIKYYDRARSYLESQQFETDVVTPTGRPSVQSGWLIPWLENGQFGGMVCNVRDITEHRQAEEKIRASERKYSRLVQESPDIIISIDKDGRFISCNPMAEQISGYSKEELIGKSFIQTGLLTDDLLNKALAIFDSILKGEKLDPFPLTIITRRGDRVILEANARRINYGVEDPIVQLVLRDITERAKFEEQLRHLNESLEAAQEIARVGYWTYDFTTGRAEWSRMMYKIMGVNPADGVPAYEHCKDMFHPDDWKVLDQAVVDCTKGTAFDLIVRTIKADQPVQYLRTMGFPRYDDRDEIAEIYGTVQDITELKAAEKAICRSEQMYKSLYELSPNGVFLLDRESRIIFVNRRIHEWLGYGDEDLVGKLALELPFIRAHSREIMRENFKNRMKGDHIPAYEIEVESRNGQIFVGELTATIIHSEETQCMVVLRDVTEQHRVQEELRKSEERYRSVVDNMAVGISLVDTDMRIHAINPQMKKWFSHIDVSGNPRCYESYLNSARVKPCPGCPVHKTLEDGQIHEAVTEMGADGVTRSFRILSAPIKSADGKVESIIEVMEDITDRLKMERELLKSEKLESIGILAGGIAHDFNNILVAILGNISLAKLRLEPDSEITCLLQKAENASERARDLTQQLLTFSRGGEPIKKVVNVAKLLKDTVSFSLHGANVVGEYDIADDLLKAEVDIGQFSQVINNLIINAIQAMPGGGTIFIHASNADICQAHLRLDPGDYIKISIRDRGHGILPEYMGKIFDPFFTTKSDGNGLGLASCYSIIKKHGGHIEVDSLPGQGTTFTIFLPATRRDEEESDPAPDKLARGRGRILVIDDDEWVRQLAQDILEKSGYNVRAIANGEEAVRVFMDAHDRGEAFDAAIIDLTIPGGIGGKDIIHKLKDIDPGLKAVVSSGYSNDPVMANYEAYGFSGRIAKPYRASELSNIISRITNAVGKH